MGWGGSEDDPQDARSGDEAVDGGGANPSRRHVPPEVAGADGDDPRDGHRPRRGPEPPDHQVGDGRER